MKIGMNLLLWTDNPAPDLHRSLVEHIADWGFDGIEVPVAPMSLADAKQLGYLCDSLSLGRTAILALDSSSADPSSADSQLRQGAIEQIKDACEKTKEMGSDLLVGPLFQGLGRFSGKSPTQDEVARSMETLRIAGEYAAELGLRIALEPINRFEMYLANTIEDGLWIVKGIGLPNVGLLADTHHGNIEEKNVAAAWQNAMDHIFHVHISENDRGTPGAGHAIGQDVFETLEAAKYEGWLTIEAFSPSVEGLVPRLHLWRHYEESNETLARKGLAFIREAVNKAKGRD